MKSKEDILLRIEPEGIELDLDNTQVISYYSQEQIFQAMEEYANQQLKCPLCGKQLNCITCTKELCSPLNINQEEQQ